MSATQREIKRRDPLKDKLKIDRFVSRTPLHLIWRSTCNISPQRHGELLSLGYEITRGRFTEEEDNRILKNWRRVMRRFPGIDPFTTFGVRPKSVKRTFADGMVLTDDKLTNENKLRTSKKTIMLRMAYKLNDRLICDIYKRCKKIISYKTFKYSSVYDVSRKKHNKVVRDLYEHHESPVNVSVKYGISPSVIACIKRRPIHVEPFFWKPEDDLMLEMAIERQFNRDPYKIPTHEINWRKVSREMLTCGYNLIPGQIYRRWHRLNPNMVGLKNVLDRDGADSQSGESD